MLQPIIIKKVKKQAHAHHGGAWKIAYADFVTAMMAFFLLLWLLSMTTDEQKQGLADYFAPPSVSQSTSGAGGTMGGQSLDDTGAKMSGSAPDAKENVSISPQTMGGRNDAVGGESDAVKQSQTDLDSTYNEVFHSAATSIKQAWEAMPEITEISDNLLVEVTEEGLNIVIMDQEGRPMFPEGSKYPLEVTARAIAVLGPILQQLPNQIKISGHTAAGGLYTDPRYGPWELSSDRANVVRAILGEYGLSEDHIHSVLGRSVAEPLFPNEPYMAANQRIKITVLSEPPPVPPDLRP